jgi:dihydroorotase-like cyclic amidohydrolase
VTVDLIIRNAHVVTERGEFHGGVAVDEGKIVAIGSDDGLPAARRTIDAQGQHLLPGVVDPHCHLGGAYNFVDDIFTETVAAAKGGVTTALQFTRIPEGSYVDLFNERKAIGEANAITDFGFHFAIQNEQHIADIPRIAAETGVQSFKLYFGYQPGSSISVVPANDGWVLKTMKAVRELPHGVVAVHCENSAIGESLKADLIAHGRIDLGAFTESRPAFSELETINRMIFLAEQTGCPLYIVHTTIGSGVRAIADARARGVDVSVETCPHYLTRSAYDEDLDISAKILPPLRDRDEIERLWAELLQGRVSTLGSDHVPYPAKHADNVWDEKPGIVNFEWELPLLVTEGVVKRGLSFPELVRLNSAEPARRFGMYPQKGSLLPGADADLVLINMSDYREPVATEKGSCIYTGMKLTGWPTLTMSRGRVVFDEHGVDESARGSGRVVTPS